jgi:hypothetical protein
VREIFKESGVAGTCREYERYQQFDAVRVGAFPFFRLTTPNMQSKDSSTGAAFKMFLPKRRASQ